MTTKAEFGVIWDSLDPKTRRKLMQRSFYASKDLRKGINRLVHCQWAYLNEFQKAYLASDYDLLKFNEILRQARTRC